MSHPEDVYVAAGEMFAACRSAMLEDIAARFTCVEANAMANLIRTLAGDAEAEAFEQAHALGDDDEGDEHFDKSGYRPVQVDGVTIAMTRRVESTDPRLRPLRTRPMTNAVAYLRVSTQEQVANGLGLDIQRDLIVAWASSHERVIVAWHVDAGISGSNGLDSRVGLADAMSVIEAGEAIELVVADLSRLARDLILQECLLVDIEELGGAVRSCEEQEDRVLAGSTDDADGGASRTFIRQVLGAAKQYDRALIRLRLVRGLRAKAAAGGYTGHPIGFGAKLVNDRVELDPERAEVLERIAARRADGATYDEIAAELAADGIAGPKAPRWYASTVRQTYLRHCRLVGIEPVGRAHPAGLTRAKRK